MELVGGGLFLPSPLSSLPVSLYMPYVLTIAKFPSLLKAMKSGFAIVLFSTPHIIFETFLGPEMATSEASAIWAQSREAVC
jgi:hypothetical protein